MSKIKWVFIASLVILLLAIPLLAACPSTTPTTTPPTTPTTTPPTTTTPPPEYTLYVGGCFALTGAYAEDMAASLAGYEDYIAWVNDNKMLAPWYPDKTIPDNVTFEVLWRDDELNVEKVLSIYEELKGKGLLVERVSGSPQALALMDLMNEDRIGATSAAAGPYLLTPPKTIFTNYPIYTDDCAAFADWFKENWTEDRAPRFAFLTADNAMGTSVVTDEMKAYLEGIGYVIVGEQYVPLVPTAPPTTQLLWLKDNKVDACFGVMINPGSQPTVKEMNNLGMGPGQAYEITFGCATPSHIQVFISAMGAEGNGFCVAGGYASWDDPGNGMTFANDLLAANRPDKVGAMHIMYVDGIVEAMTQVEAMRLAMANTGKSADQLTSADVLEQGFYMIKNLDTGGITGSPLTYGPDDVEGADEVRIQQIQGGKIVDMGTYPCRHIYKK
jgi:branched-chain amino acid transport system substrate-binding protein